MSDSLDTDLHGDVVLLTGMSGGGKSVAMHALEDAGYFCVDNLPAELLLDFLHLEQQRGERRVAIAVDVRSAGEHAAGAIPGAVNLPLDELRGRLDELPDGDLVVYCAVGLRGYLSGRILAQHGRAAHNLDGGFTTVLAGTGGRVGATA